MRRTLTMFSLCALLLGTATLIAQAAGLYRWVDENGVVHYSDTLPDSAVEKQPAIEPRYYQGDPEEEMGELKRRRAELEAENARIRAENERLLRAFRGEAGPAGEEGT